MSTFELDKGQIVMARQLGQSISKTVTFIGCSQSAAVSTYQKCSKEQTVINQQYTESTNNEHDIGPWSNERRFPGLCDVWGNVLLRNWDSSIHAEATLTCTIYPSTIADHAHLVTKIVVTVAACGLLMMCPK